MKSRMLWFSLPVLILLSSACSGKGEGNGEDALSTAAATSIPAAHNGAGRPPVITARNYAGGSAKVTVTGSFQFDADIAINAKASLSDGEMTWLQYGVSGSEPPEALVTVSTDEVGISVGRGKLTATISAEACAGNMNVTADSITGRYTCRGVTSFDAGSGGMGNVDIQISFSATS